MANEEQRALLKQGVEGWNRWRIENPAAKIDLREADLWHARLTGANLTGADLAGADLTEANLSRCDLIDASLREAQLSGIDLTRANLTGVDLVNADLSGAHLRGADLTGADLTEAELSLTDFTEADLAGADLTHAILRQTKLLGCKCGVAELGWGILGDSDLSQAVGLDTVVHRGPSILSIGTIAQSKGKIPDVFLRGCGLSDWEIESVKLYHPGLTNHEINDIQYRIYDLRAGQALQISPLFISYSHADGEFVDKIGNALTQRGVRYWRDTHEMKAGRIEKQIDHAIRQNPTVLLVLSGHSLNSDWVEHEVRTARALEKELGRDTLCPVALDDSWKSSRWPKRVTEQIMEYNILDFSKWRDNSRFDGMFRKLIDGLELFYKG